MLSGFNTEIAVEGTFFHIQTEARKEAGIETAVHVKGAVVHSLTTLHPDLSKAPDDNERQLMRLLEEQHQRVIAQIRSGEIKPPQSPDRLQSAGKMMTVHLNGEQREVPDGLTLTGLIEWLELPADRVAVERNLEVVKRADWDKTRIGNGDRLEIVRMVGGGSGGCLIGSKGFPCILR